MRGRLFFELYQVDSPCFDFFLADYSWAICLVELFSIMKSQSLSLVPLCSGKPQFRPNFDQVQSNLAPRNKSRVAWAWVTKSGAQYRYPDSGSYFFVVPGRRIIPRGHDDPRRKFLQVSGKYMYQPGMLYPHQSGQPAITDPCSAN